MITRVVCGACESINPAIVELYCVEISSTPSLRLLKSSEFLRSDTSLALSVVVYFLYLICLLGRVGFPITRSHRGVNKVSTDVEDNIIMTISRNDEVEDMITNMCRFFHVLFKISLLKEFSKVASTTGSIVTEIPQHYTIGLVCGTTF